MTRNVIMTCSANAKHPGTVYASLNDADTNELLVSATLDYCIDAATHRAYNVVNSFNVLQWLHRNADFKAHKVK